MADVAISGLTALGAAPATNDLLVVVDVSDPTQAPTGTTKNMTTANLFTAPTITVSVTLTGGTVTANAPVLNATQTWNSGGVTFTAINLNVTDTASAAGSLLADLQVGGSSKWSVTKAGAVTQAGALTITAGGLTATTAAFSSLVQFLSDIDLATTKRLTGSGAELLRNAGGNLRLLDGTNLVSLGTMATTNGSIGNIAISNGTAPTGNPTGGGFLWVEAGVLKYRGSAGTVTPIAPA